MYLQVTEQNTFGISIKDLLWYIGVRPYKVGVQGQGEAPEALKSCAFSKDEMHYERTQFYARFNFTDGFRVQLKSSCGIYR